MADLTENLLSQAAGWEVMKMARAYLAQRQVLSSYWQSPLLRGVVQVGDMTFRASMVIKDGTDIENLCNCRDAREWGKICAHSVGVGLHWLQQQKAVATVEQNAAVSPTRSAHLAVPPPAQVAKKGLRRDSQGTPAELFVVFPPGLFDALGRGKVSLFFEARADAGRMPLNALPLHRAYAFSEQDNRLLDVIETLTGGPMPALLQVSSKELVTLLSALVGHPEVTLGKSTAVSVTRTPLALPLRLELEPDGQISARLKGAAAQFVRIESWAFANNTFHPLGLPEALA
jgi:hypothetical protein